jgi:hypothetical protein
MRTYQDAPKNAWKTHADGIGPKVGHFGFTSLIQVAAGRKSALRC